MQISTRAWKNSSCKLNLQLELFHDRSRRADEAINNDSGKTKIDQSDCSQIIRNYDPLIISSGALWVSNKRETHDCLAIEQGFIKKSRVIQGRSKLIWVKIIKKT